MLQNDPLRLPPFHFDADPDPALHFDADPDPASHNVADPDPQHCLEQYYGLLPKTVITLWPVL